MKKSKRTLQECMGKAWMYKTNQYRFLSFSENGMKITIATDSKWIDIERSQLQSFLDELLPVDEETLPAQIDTQSKLLQQNTRESINDLTSILKGNIKKLQEDPTYVKQAKEINQATRQIIEMARLEFEVHKEIQKSKRD